MSIFLYMVGIGIGHWWGKRRYSSPALRRAFVRGYVRGYMEGHADKPATGDTDDTRV